MLDAIVFFGIKSGSEDSSYNKFVLCASFFCEQIYFFLFICYNNFTRRVVNLLAYLALYRKYRPSSFDDLVGQQEVVEIIKNEILNDRLSHAYLFSGPRGTGKTSSAKIIAKMINCENLSDSGVPCGYCENCKNFNNSSDIIEIDAASNNGVDEIRELRDKANLVPTFGKYKVYIIDEVHMLTTQAFNALLKTLEEPPSHVIFILATTEFYKIPVTVVSRCQKFQFMKFSLQTISDRLRYISDNENIDVSDDVLWEIARLADGGLRDAINILDQLSSFKRSQICLDDVYQLSGVVSYQEFFDILKYIYENNLGQIICFLNQLDKSGKNLERFVIDFLDFVNEALVYSTTLEYLTNLEEKKELIAELVALYSLDDFYCLIFILNNLSINIKNSSFVKVLITVELVKFSNSHFKSKNSLVVSSENNLNIKDNNEKLTNENHFFSRELMTESRKKVRVNNAFCSASKLKKENFLLKWSYLKEKVMSNASYANISGILNDVEVLVVGDSYVVFLAQYDSLLERLNSKIEDIERVISEIFEKKYFIVFLTVDEWNYEKENYILNLKNGKKYSYMEETDTELSLENINSNNINFSREEIDSSVDRIVSVLGEDVVTFE